MRTTSLRMIAFSPFRQNVPAIADCMHAYPVASVICFSLPKCSISNALLTCESSRYRQATSKSDGTCSHNLATVSCVCSVLRVCSRLYPRENLETILEVFEFLVWRHLFHRAEIYHRGNVNFLSKSKKSQIGFSAQKFPSFVRWKKIAALDTEIWASVPKLFRNGCQNTTRAINFSPSRFMICERHHPAACLWTKEFEPACGLRQIDDVFETGISSHVCWQTLKSYNLPRCTNSRLV